MKKNRINRGLSLVMIFLLLTSLNPMVTNAEETKLEEYKIYPVPHSLAYIDGVTSIGEGVQVVYDNTIDEVTKKKVNSIFEENGLKVPTVVENPTSGKVNLLVGTIESKGPVDSYAKGHLDTADMNFKKIDAHEVQIKDNNIIVLGKDTDASFYGLDSLDAIIEQSNKKTIRNTVIKDYSNTKIRGFIEGYYGIPWSNEDRMSLMKFGGKFKATSYVFAPKDDPYHRQKWSELYPDDMLEGIGKMARVGNETKTRFVWTISPLAEVADTARTQGQDAAMALLKGNKAKMLAKFDQLYNVGVRQFGVLGDDIGQLPLDYVVELMNGVSEWKKGKGDVYDILYCPASYNSSWAWNSRELNAYQSGFPDDIQIFWTGSTTCSPINQNTIDVFKTRNNNKIVRRDPLFWLNWPVNDVDMSRVFLGKGEMLMPGIKNLAGAVTNPMQEAEASKVAIFALADYTWNTENFNNQKSWDDSFEYIEPDATEDLHIISKHMSDANPNGLKLSESEDIKQLLDKVLVTAKSNKSLKVISPELIDELKKIADASNNFLKKTKNEKLREELAPFIKALRDMVLADIEFIKADIAIEDGDINQIWEHGSKARSYRKQSLNYDRPMLEGTKKAKPAQKRLQPFTEELANKIDLKITEALKINAPVLKASIFTNVDKYKELEIKEGVDLTSILGDYKIKLDKDDYVGVKLSCVKEVTEVKISNINGLTLEYSVNGYEWKPLTQLVGSIEARYIRYINKGNDPVEFNLDSFNIKSREILAKSVAETNYSKIDNKMGLIDGDLSSAVWLKEDQVAGKYITYDLGQVINLRNLKLYVNKGEHDYPRHACIQSSTDGENWKNIMELGNQTDSNKDEARNKDKIEDVFDVLESPYRAKEVKELNEKARYLKFEITKNKVGDSKWVRFQELVINDGEVYPESNNRSIKTTSEGDIGFGADKIIDGKIDTSFKTKDAKAGELIYHVGEVGLYIKSHKC